MRNHKHLHGEIWCQEHGEAKGDLCIWLAIKNRDYIGKSQNSLGVGILDNLNGPQDSARKLFGRGVHPHVFFKFLLARASSATTFSINPRRIKTSRLRVNVVPSIASASERSPIQVSLACPQCMCQSLC